VSYSLHPEVIQELREASSFYAEQSGPSLARAYLAEVDRLITLICQHPRMGSPYRGGTRRFVMRRFPYALVYVVAADEVRVVAVAHHSRRPG
jgi:toxin ParE1/3/4